jgi:hypothetical protein
MQEGRPGAKAERALNCCAADELRAYYQYRRPKPTYKPGPP